MPIDNEQIEKRKQDIITGSAVLQAPTEPVVSRVEYMSANMASNKAYVYARQRAPAHPADGLLRDHQLRYQEYRRRWAAQPADAIARRLDGRGLVAAGYGPLCVDLEVASVCDLACAFCYRESLATPDALIDVALGRRVIDQAAELGVPSMKFNWRGEPLLHPQLHVLIDYAKRAGILETIVNTNATRLTEKAGQKLIDAGLDWLIISFDGGTRATYEKMRVGRFRTNTFDHVHGNIIRFAEMRARQRALFPRTKIQMILTADSYREQAEFFALFRDYIDEVTVTPYSERGGQLEELSEQQRAAYLELCSAVGMPEGTPCLREPNGQISVAVERRPCEQPYQRLMVTYDGRVAMCCHDWGAMHPIGYVDDACFADDEADKRAVLERRQAKDGTPRMLTLVMPPRYNEAPKVVQRLGDIWVGPEVTRVRDAHARGAVNDVAICQKCSFKDTYRWVTS